MISIDLLRRTRKGAGGAAALPWKKAVLSLVLLSTAGLLFLFRDSFAPAPGVKLVRVKQITPLKREVTPFDVVEDIVDDIQGGRFKVKSLNRLSSPVHLSPNEKKVYERFYIKLAFDVLNACIRPGMGFSTITLDHYGNFFVYGAAERADEVHAFRAALLKQESILEADTLDFKRPFGGAGLLFALKGFLSFNIIDRFYEDDSWSANETLPASSRTVLADVVRLGKQSGVASFKRIEWGGYEPYGAAKKHALRLQLECPYGALMRWIKAMYEQNCQIGYSRISLTSQGRDRVMVAAELYVYSRN